MFLYACSAMFHGGARLDCGEAPRGGARVLHSCCTVFFLGLGVQPTILHLTKDIAKIISIVVKTYRSTRSR